jgi:hydrogenase maturation protease
VKTLGDTLVLGLGNPLRRDDGVGPRLVSELAQQGLPRGVTALDGGTGGLRLLSVMEGWGRVVVVDAADVSRAPGEFVRFVPGEAGLVGAAAGVGACRARPISLHNLGLAELLALARRLGRSLPEIVVYGVQPADLGWGEGLSQAVEAGIPRLREAVLEETTGECHAEDPGD